MKHFFKTTSLFLMSLVYYSCDQPLRQEQRVTEVVAGGPIATGTAQVITRGRRIHNQDCWMTLYRESGFHGASVTIYDGINLPALEMPDGADWRDRVQSLEMGPNATAMLYQQENYQQPAISLSASTQQPDIAFEVRSLRMLCLE
jgi:hypothetical protein